MRNSSRPWTRDDDRRLLELHAAGRSHISLAAALKRTRSAIRNRLENLRTRSVDDRSTDRHAHA